MTKDFRSEKIHVPYTNLHGDVGILYKEMTVGEAIDGGHITGFDFKDDEFLFRVFEEPQIDSEPVDILAPVHGLPTIVFLGDGRRDDE